MPNPILVFVENKDGTLKKGAIEALSEAKRLSDALKSEVVALVIGNNLGSAAKEPAFYGATKVLTVEGAAFGHYTTAPYTKAMVAAFNKVKPDAILFPATLNGKDLAGSVAGALGTSALQDVISINADGGTLTARRPVYAGKAIITVKALKAPSIISLRPKMFTAAKSDQSKQSQVEKLDVAIDANDQRVKVKEVLKAATAKIELTEADIIVSGGRGMKGPEHYKIIEELAAILKAAVGASRAAVDAGWRPHEDQVGQTGKTVCPTMYVACGISGAIQHLAGMSSSKCIVAINKDPEAPIFKVANYGIVGDLFEVVPALANELKKNQG
ncbi:MAG: electron transfer flavoprotein subunit alpha/FixB family protein [Planctomycetes bacterium]|nr:electron transfer flavoprotein subunit alpha/FixB family protein [Planctomycetota bacterium]